MEIHETFYHLNVHSFPEPRTYGHHPGFQITHHVVPTVPQLLLRSNESGPKVQSDETPSGPKKIRGMHPPCINELTFCGRHFSWWIAIPRLPKSSSHTWWGSVFETQKAFSWNIWGGSNTYSIGIWMSKIFICSSSKSPKISKESNWSVLNCCLTISRFFLMVSKRHKFIRHLDIPQHKSKQFAQTYLAITIIELESTFLHKLIDLNI